MKKIIFLLCLVFFLNLPSLLFSQGDFSEGIDYNAVYIQRGENAADVLHINFFTVRPSAATAERIVINHLKALGQRSKNVKNIIGSAFYSANGSDGSYSKIKFGASLGAYVWVDKAGRAMTFPSYMAYLKKARDQKRAAARAGKT